MEDIRVHIVWFIGSTLAVIGAGIVLSWTADCIAERSGLARLVMRVVTGQTRTTALSAAHLVTVLVVIAVTALAIQGILTRDERRIWIWERDATVMILAILAGIGVIYLAR